MKDVLVFFAVIAASTVTVAGDYFIKLSGNSPDRFMDVKNFILGIFFYVVTGFGWFFIMKYIKLSSVGIIYGVTTAILLAIIGVVFFKENLNTYEIIGISLGIFALILLSRFSA